MKREIMVVDDERTVRVALKGVLEAAGYRVRVAADATGAIEAIRDKRPDLVLLDVMMPMMDGFDACSKIKKSAPDLPVVFLTALDSPSFEIQGLEKGGDDYIAKTSCEEVLLARIASVLRRVSRDNEGGSFYFGDWLVEPAGFFMVSGGTSRKVLLSEREVAILRAFACHSGEVFNRDYLSRTFKLGEEDIGYEAVSMLIVRLRAKLGKDGRLIRTIRGMGYIYDPLHRRS